MRIADWTLSLAPVDARAAFLDTAFRMNRPAYLGMPLADQYEVCQAVETLRRVFGPSAWCADDMLTWFRTCGFLSDETFVAAFGPYIRHAALRRRAWRIYTACWAARASLAIDGAFLDLGCYQGLATDIVYRYCGAAADARRWWLYDLFDPPRDGSYYIKPAHRPSLAAEVRALYAGRPNVTVVEGRLPEALALPPAIAFAALDLNDGEAEVAVLDAIYDSVAAGGTIVLDDYGDAQYAGTQRRQQAFFATRGQAVYECPTGQGLVIKR